MCNIVGNLNRRVWMNKQDQKQFSFMIHIVNVSRKREPIVKLQNAENKIDLRNMILKTAYNQYNLIIAIFK